MTTIHQVSATIGDITTFEVDMIVNAANSALSGGGGVDGAIHRAAGSRLREACRALGRCEVGDAKLTPGFDLKAKWVAHAVGPVWRGGDHNESDLLRSCYRRALDLAREAACTSVAFPAISTGAYKFPPELATKIAVSTVREQLATAASPPSILFVCANDRMHALYNRELAS